MEKRVGQGVGKEVPEAAFKIGLTAEQILELALGMKNKYQVECRDEDGNLKWVEDISNMITTEGAKDIANKYLKGSSYTAAFYVTLFKNNATLVIGDTAASHSWTEVVQGTDVSQATRPALTLGSPTGTSTVSIDNSGSVATFSMLSSITIYGAAVLTANTFGGTGGVLYGQALFGSSRSVVSGDTLNVTVTATYSAS